MIIYTFIVNECLCISRNIHVYNSEYMRFFFVRMFCMHSCKIGFVFLFIIINWIVEYVCRHFMNGQEIGADKVMRKDCRKAINCLLLSRHVVIITSYQGISGQHKNRMCIQLIQVAAGHWSFFISHLAKKLILITYLHECFAVRFQSSVFDIFFSFSS